MATDQEIIDAFRLFLEGVSQSARPNLHPNFVNKEKVLAALDILDPEFAEELTKKWADE